MIGQIADKIADEGFNIEDMSNKSRDSIAINLIDVDKPIDQSQLMRSVRLIMCLWSDRLTTRYNFQQNSYQTERWYPFCFVQAY